MKILRAETARQTAPGTRRSIGAALVVNALGNGLFATTGVLFFLKIRHFPPLYLGVGLTCAAALGMAAGPLLGHAADRHGPRRLYALLLFAQGVGMAAYTVVGGFWAYLAATCAITAFERGAAAARGAVIARAVSREERVRFRAVMRSLANAGMAVGAAGGALVLTIGDRSAYLGALVANAVSFALTGLLILGLPRRIDEAEPAAPTAPEAPPPASACATAALRDRPFLLITALNAVLLLNAGMIEVGLPVWIIQGTRAPKWTVAALVLINTMLVVGLQVPATKGVETVRDAAVAARRSGALLAVACLLTAASGHGSAAVATLALIVVGLFHAGGEIMQAAGAWVFSFELAPDYAVGQYQGVFNTGRDIGVLVAPLVFTTLVTAFGGWSWIGLGVAFVAAGVALRPAAAFAARDWGA